ncbi:MAG: DUF5667 domain-containing protein [Patescibacteria group bacterium]|nr:DUF5667 domain-containing protein [bacterium]MDZ4240852.1 DUF5667 domain-containing protein [Patescibacteria group bacterium]
MNNFEKQLHTIGQTIRMTSQEKGHMKAVLEHSIRTAPVKKENLLRPENRWPNSFFFLLLRNPMPIALILALVVGGGVSFAAEGSLPGDLLYPVKVSVNEEIKQTLTFSSEAKAQWESERAERRLVEAASLSAEGKLSAANEQKIAEQFEKHAQKVAERVKEFEERDPERASEVTSRFETSLEAHEEILTRLSLRNSDDENDSTGRMLAVVRENRETVNAVPAAASVNLRVAVKINEDSLALSSSPDDSSDGSKEAVKAADVKESSVLRMLKLAESKSHDVSKIIQKFETSLSTSTMTQVKADFATVTEGISAGKSFLNNKEYREAFAELQNAFNLAYRLEILLRAEQKHKLQIFPSILPIPAEEDDNNSTATSSVSSSSRVNTYLQKEADRMKEKADIALTEARLKLSEKVLRITGITDKAQNLIAEAENTSVQAEVAYAQGDYTSALRLWNISYANAKTASGLLSNMFQSDSESGVRGSDDSHNDEVKIESETEIEIETEGSEVKTKSGIQIKVF